MRLKPFNLLRMCLGAIVVAAPMTKSYASPTPYLWGGTTTTDDLFLDTNWTPTAGAGTGPGSGNIGTFQNQGGSNPAVTAVGQSIGTIYFGGGTYPISWDGPYDFTIDGAGVNNASGVTQSFNINNGGSLTFENTSSANIQGLEVEYNLGDFPTLGTLNFIDDSTASYAEITAVNSSVVNFGVSLGSDTASADTAQIVANDDSHIEFWAHTNADEARITANDSSQVQFNDYSHAHHARITANDTAQVILDTYHIGFESGPHIELNDSAQLLVYRSNRVGNLNSGSTGTNVQLYDSSLNPTYLKIDDNYFDSDVYAGQITGVSGSELRKVGEGSFQITSAQSSIWDAKVFNGTLIGDSTNLNRNVFIDDNGTALFSQDADGDLNFGTDQLTGDGYLVKSGTGSLNITTDNAFAGDTEVVAGDLAINGIFGTGAGTVFVDSEGTLSGTGTINDAVEVNGTIAPGNSIGTLNIVGSYTQNSDSTYEVEVSGLPTPDSSLIAITGSATINGGTVAVSSPDGTFVIDQPYTILTATESGTGAYDNAIQSINPYLVPYLTYIPDETLLLTLGTDFESFAFTRNQRSVARQIDDIFDPSSGLQDVLQNLVTLSPDRLNEALDQLSGEQYAALFQISQLSNRRFLRDLYGPLLFGRPFQDDCCIRNCCDDIEIWQTVHYGRSFLKGNHEAHGFKDRSIDATLGVQLAIDDCLKAGIAVFYENDHVNFNLDGRARVNVIRGALYGIYQNECLYGLANAVFGYSHFNVKRDIEFADIERRAHAVPKVYDTSFYFEGGLNYAVTECLKLQPFFGAEGGYYWHNHFEENGAHSLDLEAKRKLLWAFNTRLGLRATTTVSCDIVLSADVAWLHWYSQDDNKIRLRFEEFGRSFNIRGPKQKRDAVDGSIYIGKRFCDSLTLFARAFGERSENFSSYNAEIGFDFQL